MSKKSTKTVKEDLITKSEEKKPVVNKKERKSKKSNTKKDKPSAEYSKSTQIEPIEIKEPKIEPEQVEKAEEVTSNKVDDGKIECSPCKMASVNKALKLEYIKAGAASTLLILGSIVYLKNKETPLFFNIIMGMFAYILFQVVIKIFELNKLKSTLKVKTIY